MWLILACVSYEEGQARVGGLSCELAEACGTLDTFGYDDVDACVEHAEAQPWDEANCPEYDAAKMSECIDAYETAVAEADCEWAPGDECQVCG